MIRPMLPADAETVAELIRTAFATVAPLLDPAPSALRETADSIRRQLEAGGGAVWDEGGVQACVLWRVEHNALYLGRLSVRPEWQGRKIARRLLEAAEAEARARRLPRITLAVRLALPRNRHVFAAAGFRETRQHAHEGFPSPTFADAEKWL